MSHNDVNSLKYFSKILLVKNSRKTYHMVAVGRKMVADHPAFTENIGESGDTVTIWNHNGARRSAQASRLTAWLLRS
jgi:hypothetical protein